MHQKTKINSYKSPLEEKAINNCKNTNSNIELVKVDGFYSSGFNNTALDKSSKGILYIKKIILRGFVACIICTVVLLAPSGAQAAPKRRLRPTTSDYTFTTVTSERSVTLGSEDTVANSTETSRSVTNSYIVS